MVRPERFELPASWFVARRSIQLSYGRNINFSTSALKSAHCQFAKLAINRAGTPVAFGARILPHQMPITIPTILGGQPGKIRQLGAKTSTCRNSRARPIEPAGSSSTARAKENGRTNARLSSSLSVGGEGGIRTLDGLLTHTPLAGARLRPLGHLSGQAQGPNRSAG